LTLRVLDLLLEFGLLGEKLLQWLFAR